MARQKGSIMLEGRLGEVVFYRTKYGQIARTLGSAPKEAAVAPGISAKQDANREFGYASRLGKLMRVGVSHGLRHVEVGSTYHRLNKQLVALVRQDLSHKRGERRLVDGPGQKLRGFNWREHSGLATLLDTNYTLELDRDTGKAQVQFADLVPGRDIRLGEGATHAEILLVVVSVEDAKNKFVTVHQSGGMIDLRSMAGAVFSLNCTPDDAGGKVVIAGIGIQAYEEDAGELRAMVTRNAFEIGGVGFPEREA